LEGVIAGDRDGRSGEGLVRAVAERAPAVVAPAVRLAVGPEAAGEAREAHELHVTALAWHAERRRDVLAVADVVAAETRIGAVEAPAVRDAAARDVAAVHRRGGHRAVLDHDDAGGRRALAVRAGGRDGHGAAVDAGDGAVEQAGSGLHGGD